ncbi:MAG TPA: hypothetical protein PK694_10945 [Rhodospirillales bacterium]|nr:hypothetical protein [Rhodospirillales bacterium]
MVVWKQLEGGLFDIYEIIPGFVFSAVAVVAASLLTEEPTGEVVAGFDRTLEAKASGIIHAPAE